MPETHNTPSFDGLGLPPSILKSLDKLGFRTPTPIQARAIPLALEGRDVLGIAQTGTGKTLAFGLPMLARLEKGQTALILAPTRELAQQIEEALRALGARTVLLVGGTAMGPQISRLRSRPDVLVATPGRLLDHLQQGTASLERVKIAVLDEADRMLDLGFAPTIRRILERVPAGRQTLLFSATMPKGIRELAESHLNHPVEVEVATAGTAAELVEQELVVIPHDEKPDMLAQLLAAHDGTTLVFARTRHGARKLARAVGQRGHTVAELHSDRTLAQRRTALSGFKSGQFRVLVATDIAARGIDVKEIALVINYDVPENPEDYVHRIGRTGRAGSTGRAITLATPEQRNDVRDIERLIRQTLPRSPHSRGHLETAAAPSHAPRFRGRPGPRPGGRPSSGPGRPNGPRPAGKARFR